MLDFMAEQLGGSSNLQLLPGPLMIHLLLYELDDYFVGLNLNVAFGWNHVAPQRIESQPEVDAVHISDEKLT